MFPQRPPVGIPSSIFPALLSAGTILRVHPRPIVLPPLVAKQPELNCPYLEQVFDPIRRSKYSGLPSPRRIPTYSGSRIPTIEWLVRHVTLMPNAKPDSRSDHQPSSNHTAMPTLFQGVPSTMETTILPRAGEGVQQQQMRKP